MYARFKSFTGGIVSLDSVSAFALDYTNKLGGSAKTVSKAVGMVRLEHLLTMGNVRLTAPDTQELKARPRHLEFVDTTDRQTKDPLRLQHILAAIALLDLRVAEHLLIATLLLVIYDGLFRTGEILRDPHSKHCPRRAKAFSQKGGG